MSASFLLRCTGVTCYTPRCLEAREASRVHHARTRAAASKVPTVAFAFGPKRGSNARWLSIIGAFAAILMLPTTLSAQINPGGAITPDGRFPPSVGFTPGGGFSPGAGFTPGGGFTPGAGFSPGAGFTPGGGFSPGGGFAPGGGFTPGPR